MRNFLDRIRALVTGHNSKLKILPFIGAVIVALIAIARKGFGPVTFFSLIVACIMAINPKHVSHTWVGVWAISALCNFDGIVLLLGAIATIMMWGSTTGIPHREKGTNKVDEIREEIKVFSLYRKLYIVQRGEKSFTLESTGFLGALTSTTSMFLVASPDICMVPITKNFLSYFGHLIAQKCGFTHVEIQTKEKGKESSLYFWVRNKDYTPMKGRIDEISTYCAEVNNVKRYTGSN